MATTSNAAVSTVVSVKQEEAPISVKDKTMSEMDIVLPPLEPMVGLTRNSSPVSRSTVISSAAAPASPMQLDENATCQGTKRKRDQEQCPDSVNKNKEPRENVESVKRRKTLPVKETGTKRVETKDKNIKAVRHKSATPCFTDEDETEGFRVPSAVKRRTIIVNTSDEDVRANSEEDNNSNDDECDQDTTESDQGNSDQDASDSSPKRKKTQVWTVEETRLYSRLLVEIQTSPQYDAKRQWATVADSWKPYVDNDTIHPRNNRDFSARSKSRAQRLSIAKKMRKVQAKMSESRKPLQQDVASSKTTSKETSKGEAQKEAQKEKVAKDDKELKVVAERTIKSEKRKHKHKHKRDDSKDSKKNIKDKDKVKKQTKQVSKQDRDSIASEISVSNAVSTSNALTIDSKLSICQNAHVKQAMENLQAFCKLYDTDKDEEFVASQATEYIQKLCKYMSTEQKTCVVHVLELLRHFKSIFKQRYGELSIQVVGPYAKILRNNHWQPIDPAYEGKYLAEIIRLLPNIPKLFNLDLCRTWFHCIRHASTINSSHAASFLRCQVQCRLSRTDYDDLFGQYMKLALHDYTAELTKRHVNTKTMTAETMNTLTQFVTTAREHLSRPDFEALRDKNRNFIHDMIKSIV